MDLAKIWKEIIESLKQEVSLANLSAYFKPVDLEVITDDTVVISAPSAFIAENIKSKFGEQVDRAIKQVLGKELKLEVKIDASKLLKLKESNKEADDLFSLPQFNVTAAPPVLSQRYNLENYVVGLTNNLAYAAAQAVVANPGTSYNPLYVYGGTGVGKTHLMVGIGNSITKANPNSKVIYCSSERFTNDYVEAIQKHRMTEFRSKYRQADILLVDDIQFFSGREGTQEEFFHTFNELQAKNSQMVFTSDRPPNEIEKLEDRIKSRFQGGLMVDIQQPDFDTRVAILKAKCLEKGEIIPEEVLKIMAGNLETNIRELEGRLVAILQNLKTQGLSASQENVLKLMGSNVKSKLPIDQKKVLSTVCGYFDIEMKDLTGPKRNKELVLPRHLVMFILSEELEFTVERIGQILGGRDHTTVMHGRDKIRDLISKDREVSRVFMEVKEKLST